MSRSWRQEFWKQLRTGEIARWPNADRCLFICVIVFVLYLYAAGLISYLEAHVDQSVFIDRAGLVLLQRVSYGTVAAWALLGLVALVGRRRASDSAWFVHAPIQLYALNSGFFSYMMGPVTTPFFPFAFLGGMLVSIPLFGYAATCWGAGTMLALVVGASVAEQWGVIPYAPLLRDWPMEEGKLSTAWLLGLGSFELVALALSLVLAMLLIDQLRQREQALLERGENLREAADELKVLGSTLTARNEQLRQQAGELEVARDAAQASDLAKSRFLSRVSHETRTPLSGILGFAELLQGRHFGELNERQASYLQHIRESGQHLLELINDLLDVTKLDSGVADLTIEEVAPAQAVLAVVENLEVTSREKGVEIINEVGPDAPALEVDRRRFRQILDNLLANAVKFTPAAGSVGVRWRLEPGGWLCVEVWDSGFGIAADDLEFIFDEFHQVDRKRDEALGGSGIGLALTLRLAKLHGGHIRVESEVGRGSNFFLLLPLRQPGLRTSRVSQGRHTSPQTWGAFIPGARVLVAEDNPANAAVILGLLEVRGLAPRVARSGPEAVERARLDRPHLVLMDIQMPGCDGFEALAQIRADGRLADVPIVAMTAGASEQDRMRYLQAGFDAFLSKPIDSGLLDEQLQRFLARAKES